MHNSQNRTIRHIQHNPHNPQNVHCTLYVYVYSILRNHRNRIVLFNPLHTVQSNTLKQGTDMSCPWVEISPLGQKHLAKLRKKPGKYARQDDCGALQNLLLCRFFLSPFPHLLESVSMFLQEILSFPFKENHNFFDLLI